MRRTAFLAIVFIGVHLSPEIVHAGLEIPAIEKGTIELSFDILYSEIDMEYQGSDLAEISRLRFRLSVGYFLTKYHEVFVGCGFEKIENPPIQDSTDFSGSFGYSFNLTTLSEIFVPYVGASMNFRRIENLLSSESGWGWSMNGGLRFLLIEHVSIYFGPEYSFEKSGGFDFKTIGLSGGFSILF